MSDDLSARPEPCGQPERSVAVLPLPREGEPFTEKHIEGIREVVEPIFRRHAARFVGFEAEVPLDDIVTQVVARALRAGAVRKPVGFLSTVTRRLFVDVGRRVSRYQRLIPARELHFEADAFPAIQHLTGEEADLEASIAEETLKHLVWGMPEMPPSAVAVMARWRASEGTRSLEEICHLANVNFALVHKVHRNWLEYYYLTRSARVPLAWLLREQPWMPLCLLHYYYAAGCNFSPSQLKLGGEIQVLYNVAVRRPSALDEHVDQVREKARKNSNRTRKEWRDTEEGYLKNLKLSRETLIRLTELF